MTTRTADMMREEGPPWAECPHPERWSAWTYVGVEVEVARWLASTCALLKPDVVIDTGTGHGVSATHLALGCRDNGFGHVYSQDTDPGMVESARSVCERMGLDDWLSIRQGGDLDELLDHYGIGEVDLFFCDAGSPYGGVRANELRRMAPRMSARGVMITHDTSPAWEPMRSSVDELEGVQIIHLPTPRGLTIMRAIRD